MWEKSGKLLLQSLSFSLADSLPYPQPQVFYAGDETAVEPARHFLLRANNREYGAKEEVLVLELLRLNSLIGVIESSVATKKRFVTISCISEFRQICVILR